MNTQTTTIEIDSATAALLQNKAAAQGVSLEVLLRDFAASTNGQLQPVSEAVTQSSLDEFMAAMESLAENDVEPLPRDFSREDIYFLEA